MSVRTMQDRSICAEADAGWVSAMAAAMVMLVRSADEILAVMFFSSVDAFCLVPSFNGSNVGIVIRKLGLEVPDDLRRLESRDLHGF